MERINYIFLGDIKDLDKLRRKIGRLGFVVTMAMGIYTLYSLAVSAGYKDHEQKIQELTKEIEELKGLKEE
jgi:hypothetical protein